MATSSPTPSRGRPIDPNSTSGKIRTLLATGMAPGDIAKKLGCKPGLVYGVKASMAGGGRAKNKKSGRGPGRPPKAKAAAAPKQIDGLASILRAVQGAERERVRMRAALEKIQAVLRDVMA